MHELIPVSRRPVAPWLAAAAALLLAAGALAPAAAQAPRPRPAVVTTAALPPVPGEVIVAFKPGAALLRRGSPGAPTGGAAPEPLQAELQARAAALGARLGRPLTAGPALADHVQVLRAEGMDARALARQLAADPDVAWAEPNERRRRLQLAVPPRVAAPNDPLFETGPPVNRPLQTGGPVSGQWYLKAPTDEVVSGIDILSAWATTRGRPEVVVAVLDTGVRFDHPDLGRAAQGGRLLPGYDFVTDSIVANDGSGRDADPSDPGDWVDANDRRLYPSRFGDCSITPSSWHGTSTASLVGAATDNGQGMAGAAPGVQVLPVRVLGKCYGSDSDIIAGMRWSAGLSVPGVPANPTPARVLNMSLGSSGACTAGYQTAVDEILATGAVIVAAAGNSAGGAVGVPGNCRGVIAVLALRHAGTKVGFSDLGREIAIAAPGGNCIDIGPGDPCRYPILSATDRGATVPQASAWTDSFDITVGTSFSSPLVAATAGLMFSARPALTPADLRSALQLTARPFPTTGADNGTDPTPVAACRAPSADPVAAPQLQCYCNTTWCGAGMLDAGAAVAVVSGPLPRISVTTGAPTAGQPLQLASSGSLPVPGSAIVAWQWTLRNVGGTAAVFSSATNAASATLQPAAAGELTVRLTVTDELGRSASVDQTVAVAAAAPVTPPPATGGGGGGGGALGAGWLLLLAAAVAALARRR